MWSRRASARVAKRKQNERLKKVQLDYAIRSCEIGIDYAGFKVKQVSEYIGNGVFTEKAFKAGEYLLEYQGDLIGYNEALRRENVYKKDSTTGNFLFFFRYQNKILCVDATKDDICHGRTVNDAAPEDPMENVLMKVIVVKKKPHLCMFAKRDIMAGEELRYDYGVSDLPWRNTLGSSEKSPCQNEWSSDGGVPTRTYESVLSDKRPSVETTVKRDVELYSVPSCQEMEESPLEESRPYKPRTIENDRAVGLDTSHTMQKLPVKMLSQKEPREEWSDSKKGMPKKSPCRNEWSRDGEVSATAYESSLGDKQPSAETINSDVQVYSTSCQERAESPLAESRVDIFRTVENEQAVGLDLSNTMQKLPVEILSQKEPQEKRSDFKKGMSEKSHCRNEWSIDEGVPAIPYESALSNKRASVKTTVHSDIAFHSVPRCRELAESPLDESRLHKSQAVENNGIVALDLSSTMQNLPVKRFSPKKPQEKGSDFEEGTSEKHHYRNEWSSDGGVPAIAYESALSDNRALVETAVNSNVELYSAPSCQELAESPLDESWLHKSHTVEKNGAVGLDLSNTMQKLPVKSLFTKKPQEKRSFLKR